MNDDTIKANTEKENIAPASVRCKFTRGFMWFFDASNLMLSHLRKWLLLSFALILINMAFSFIPYIGDLVGGAIIFLQFAILILAAFLFDSGSTLPVGQSLMQLIKEKGGRLIGLAVLMFAIVIFIGFALGIGTAISGGSQQTTIPVVSLLFLLFLFLLGFAPALIAFNNIDLWETVEASIIGMFKNVAPIIALTAVLITISIVFFGLLFSSDLIPEGIQQGEWVKLFEESPMAGVILIALSILLTAFSGAVGYVSYRDVFGIIDNNTEELCSEPSSGQELTQTDSDTDVT